MNVRLKWENAVPRPPPQVLHSFLRADMCIAEPIRHARRICCHVTVLLCLGAPAIAQAPVNLKAFAPVLETEPLPETEQPSSQTTETISSYCRERFEEAFTGNDGFVSQGCYGRTRNYTKTPAGINEYFGGFEVGEVITLDLGPDQTGLYAELLSDNLWFSAGLGYVRMGLGTLVAASDDSTGTSVEQFFQGGGNVVLRGILPLGYWINLVGESPAEAKLLRRLDTFMLFAVGADVPEMNGVALDPAVNFRIGPQITGTWSTAADDFRFFGVLDTYAVVGTEDFHSNLVGTDQGAPAAFLAAKVAIGVDLAKLIRLGVSFGGTTLDAVSQTARLSVQLLPR